MLHFLSENLKFQRERLRHVYIYIKLDAEHENLDWTDLVQAKMDWQTLVNTE